MNYILVWPMMTISNMLAALKKMALLAVLVHTARVRAVEPRIVPGIDSAAPHLEARAVLAQHAAAYVWVAAEDAGTVVAAEVECAEGVELHEVEAEQPTHCGARV